MSREDSAGQGERLAWQPEELHPEVFYIVKPDHLCQAGAMDVNLFCGGTKSMKELPELVNQGRGIFLTTELERSALRCQGLDL